MGPAYVPHVEKAEGLESGLISFMVLAELKFSSGCDRMVDGVAFPLLNFGFIAPLGFLLGFEV